MMIEQRGVYMDAETTMHNYNTKSSISPEAPEMCGYDTQKWLWDTLCREQIPQVSPSSCCGYNYSLPKPEQKDGKGE